MATAPLYSLEESVERAVVSSLTGITALTGVTILRADRSDEIALPMVTVRAEKQEELTLGAGTWAMRLAVTLATSADDTTTAETRARRYPDSTDDDGGEPAMVAYWKALTDTLTAAAFKTTVNSAEVCYVWGIEWQPSTYASGERSFSRTAEARLWANYAYSA
jgi:hypothetical protein